MTFTKTCFIFVLDIYIKKKVMKRYMLIVIGTALAIDEDLNGIADENGVHFVEGKGMFLGTFTSPLSVDEIYDMLSHRPAYMIFDITDQDKFGVNLPNKYYLALFPETQDLLDSMMGGEEPKVEKRRERQTPKPKKDRIEEFTTVDEILDKLSRNGYDRKCLTKKELEILNG